jgi:ABC-type transport system involved in multi-copper enzyme maturation permease subunit
MRLFTIAGREMRVIARQPVFLRARWMTAGAFLVLLLWLAWVYGLASNRRANANLFEAFSAWIFFYCLFVGAASSADTVSREKREGTLGLLFLSSLSGREIIAGKISSSLMTLLYSLLAIFPLLAAPLLFGGITPGTFWMTLLTLVLALWFGMTCGFVASAICTKQFPAVATATTLALLFGAGWTLLMSLLQEFDVPDELTSELAKFCPLKTLDLIESTRTVKGRQDFWQSLAFIFATTIATLILVSGRIARSWRDRPTVARKWFQWRRGANTERPPSRSRLGLRTRLLDINPILWLASRRKISSPVFIIVVSLIVLGVIMFPNFESSRSASTLNGGMIGWLIAWGLMCLGIYALTSYYAAAVAGQRLAEDRQAGSLELIFSTAVNGKTLSRGLWLAYARRMFFAVALVVFVHGMFLYLGASLIISENLDELPRGTTPLQLLWAAFTGAVVKGKTLEWYYGFTLRLLLALLLALLTGWVALGWVGRWLGLRMKHGGFAPLASLALLCAPPTLVFSICCWFANELNLDDLPEELFMPAMLWLAVLILVGHCYALCVWASTLLRVGLRPIALGLFDSEWKIIRWKTRGNILLRVLAGWTLMVLLLVFGFWWNLSARSSRTLSRWNEFKQTHGSELNFEATIPPRPADADNFFLSPSFQSLLNKKPEDASSIRLDVFRIRNNPRRSGFGSSTDSLLAWVGADFVDFESMTRLYPNAWTKTMTRPEAAQEILKRLDAWDSEFANIAEAARKCTRFAVPAPADPASLFSRDSREMTVLDHLHTYLAIRACARLELGQTNDAFQDVLTCFRLARIAATSPVSGTALQAQLLTGRTIQPIWEGLARGKWTDAQIESLQRELGSLDFLQLYLADVNRTVLAHIRLWDQRAQQGITARFPNVWTSSQPLESWRPRAFWYEDAMALYKVQEEIVASVDLDAGFIKGRDYNSSLNRMPLQGNANELLGQYRWWPQGFNQVNYAQTMIGLVRVACALERWKLAEGKRPGTLEELFPKWIEKIPTDAMLGKPVHYLQTNGTYRVFGFGQDLRDGSNAKYSDDWVWSLGTNTPTASPDSNQ